jgi:hypothetical protein
MKKSIRWYKNEEAHRALADSRAVIKLLERLIAEYKSFPQALHEEINTLVQERGHEWVELFNYSFEGLGKVERVDVPSVPQTSNVPVSLEKGKVAILPLQETKPDNVVKALANQTESKYLLLVADKMTALRLWRAKLVHGLFRSEDLFDENKFRDFLKHELDIEETKFALKVIVWLHTNWQTETIIDLNLTFFGGQYRSFIIGGNPTSQVSESIIACDYSTFVTLANQSLFTDRTVVIWTVHELEKWFSSGDQGRLTWNQVIYFLKSIYNPETNFGDRTVKQTVIEALAGADLFFGLVNLLLQRNFAGHAAVTYEKLEDDSYIFNKIRRAADNFIEKLEIVTKQHVSPELLGLINTLRDFFKAEEGRVKWIEVAESNCVFINRPLHISPIVEKIFRKYPSIMALENIPDRDLLDYHLKRTGIQLEVMSQNSDLNRKIECIVQFHEPAPEKILSLLQPAMLPAVLLLGKRALVREFYDSNYSYLKQFAQVFAESYSGGGNKILRNFGIRPQSVLVATPQFLSRNNRLISVNTLIFNGLPEVETDNPYLQALKQYWETRVPDYLGIQNNLAFYQVLQSLNLTDLQCVYVFIPSVQGGAGLQKTSVLEKLELFQLNRA